MTVTSGLSASIVRFADSAFDSPSRSVEWTIWRWRLVVVDDVVVDDPERADAGGGEVERGGGAEAAGADQEDRATRAACSWPSSPTSGISRWRL